MPVGRLRLPTTLSAAARKLLLLLILCLPIFGVLGLYLGRGRHIRRQNRFCPVFLHYRGSFIATIFIGLAAGLVTGCIGAGGGFIITPALMSAGIKGILAVGTDLFHIFAKAIMGTVVHRKMGNVSVKLAIAFLCGSILGATGGGVLNRWIYDTNPVLSDLFISLVYVFLLGFLGFYAMTDFLKLRKAGADTKIQDPHGGGKPAAASGTTGIAQKAAGRQPAPHDHL